VIGKQDTPGDNLELIRVTKVTNKAGKATRETGIKHRNKWGNFNRKISSEKFIQNKRHQFSKRHRHTRSHLLSCTNTHLQQLAAPANPDHFLHT